ncbi:alpha/beta fold hydrolase [Pseudonocardia zijingensis]|uniref:Pimeloyl-ACP methyl ester carboxylesterase n=1 Tax=Pseudonocardia zijingensis TaxID=153376 RepID=A0ABN1NA94_9PSEU
MHLHVERTGTGARTALLVHGLFSDGRCWHHLVPALVARGFRVLVPDLRGHGAGPRGRYSILDWSLDLVDTFAGERIDLAVGHSLGGLALAVAERALDVGSLVHLDPAWRMSAEQDVAFRAEWTSWLGWTDPEQLRATLGSRWSDEDVDLRWDSMWRADPAVVPGLATGAGYDHSPESATRPSLVLAADPSQYITPDHARELRARGLTVETVPGSGHSWFREDPDGFLRRLDEWIADHVPEPGPRLGLSADEVLTTTRAVRKRLDLTRPVPRELVDECVRIAVQAPTGRNRQRWDFVVVSDPDRRAAVADVWRRGLRTPFRAGGSGEAPTRMGFDSQEWARVAESLDHLDRFLHEVPLLLIPTLRVTDRGELDSIRGQAGAWGSVIPAFWSFMLAARERGLGTAWTTAHLSCEREMADVLGIPFDTVVQVALTPVAHTIGTRFRPGPRAAHRDFVHWDTW